MLFNQTKTKVRLLSDSELLDIVEALQSTGNRQLQTISDVENFLEFYRNIFGQIALEIFIAEAKAASKKKNYKQLLEMIQRSQLAKRASQTKGEPFLASDAPTTFLSSDEILLSELKK